jgi:pimeloyl-ACP methyl ester carboxylesterase
MPFAADLYYTTHEQGSPLSLPLVLIHGAGGSHLDWHSEVRRLPGHRVLAVDLPGHGRSTGTGEHTIDAYAQRILSWLHAMHFTTAVFAGHSMGGAIVLTLGLLNREVVSGMVLVSTGARLRVSPEILKKTVSPATFPQAVQWITHLSYSPNADPRLKELAADRLAKTRRSVLHGDFLACNQFDLLEQLGGSALPTCILVGEDDQLTPPRYSRYLFEQLPQASLHIIPQAGHMVMLEQPKAVTQALLAFLATITHTPGR